jgi:hypothetical protein
LQTFKFSFDPVEDAVDNLRVNALNVKRLCFNPFELKNVPSVVINVLSKKFDQILLILI